ncbi:GrpB family protein [Paenibacillus rhizovicinus]|uniref:GrpB family protein n=1 Tax=Paenibacillus rhizovicinus TaxID=2704463 RepID=A0A6C0NWJ2_9BACL|nr:GrpB family protein [Paenibacillus rhizovicinus]QHW30549.1 GrpB family protein [Paenibacillus rhizovicinus]
MLGLPSGSVFLVPWTEQWNTEYQEEAKRITGEIQPHLLAVHHIGSTAVPGLSAKPVIDIAIELPSFEAGLRCVPGLTRIGYAYKGTNILPDRHYFNKGEPRTHQIHMYRTGSEYLRKQLLFRDYLRKHAAARAGYQQLKEQLIQNNGSDKYAYSDAKTDFVLSMIMKAEQEERRD